MIPGILIAVLGGLLAFAPQFRDCYAQPKMVLIALGSFLMWVALWRRGRRGLMFAKTPIDFPLLAMFCAMVWSATFSADIGMTLLGEYGDPMHGFLQFLLIVSAFYGIAQTVPLEDSGLAGACLVAAGGVVGLYSILQRLGIDFIWWPIPKDRAISTIGSPVYLANLLSIIAPVAFGSFLVDRKAKGAALAFLAIIGGILATGSRGGMIAAGVGCAMVVYILSARAWRGILAISACVALGVVAAKRPASLLSDRMRIQTWQAAVAAAEDHPFVGTGPATFLVAMRKYRPESWLLSVPATTVQNTAHNDWLQVASTLGLFGLIAYGLMHLGAWLIVMRTWSPEKAGISGAFVAAFVAAKLNAIPLSGELALAVLLGHAFSYSDGRVFDAVEYTAPWASLGLMISALLVPLTMALAAADYNYERALGTMFSNNYEQGVAYMRRALALNPLEIEYRATASEHLIWLAQRLQGTSRDAILEEGTRIAYDVTRLHHGNPMAWDMLGTSELFDALHNSGMPPGSWPRKAELADALSNLDTAQDGDTLAAGIRLRRLQVSWTAGLPEPTRLISREYRRLAGLTNDRDQHVFICTFCGRPWAAHLEAHGN